MGAQSVRRGCWYSRTGYVYIMCTKATNFTLVSCIESNMGQLVKSPSSKAPSRHFDHNRDLTSDGLGHRLLLSTSALATTSKALFSKVHVHQVCPCPSEVPSYGVKNRRRHIPKRIPCKVRQKIHYN